MNDSDIEQAKHFDPLMAHHYQRRTREFMESLGWATDADDAFSLIGFQLRQKNSDSIIRFVLEDADVRGAWHATFANGNVKIDFQTGPDAINLGRSLFFDALIARYNESHDATEHQKGQPHE